MKQRTIVLITDGQESLHPISSEKMFLGRDKSCDIVLDDVSISRKHAAVVCRFEKVYIENVSPSGQILRDDAPIEYAELEEDMAVALGPYMLHWRFMDSSQLGGEEVPESADLVVADSESNPLGEVNLGSEENALQPYDPDAVISSEDLNGAVGDMPSEESPFSTSEVTQISQNQALPKLRIVKGEEEGREIKLDIGTVWVVGRSRKAHIHIESAKISRQHFKIIKINNRYRVQDMGSATGTKLNGVTVSDAPLQPFDTIQAGSVEIQFLLVDSALQHIGVSSLAENPHSLVATGSPFQGAAHGGFSDEHNASTIVNMPVPYETESSSTAYAGSMGEFSSSSSSSSSNHAPEQEQESEITGPAWLRPIRKQVEGLKQGWFALPKQKRMIYGSLGAVVVLLMASSFSQNKTAGTPDAANSSSNANDATISSGINIAQSPDISPTFYALSIDKQNLIRKLYSDAERSIEKSQWQAAFDSTSKILEMVDKYKRSKDMLLQSQSNLNDAMFSKLSPSVDDAIQAARSNQEQIQNFLASGTTALSEKRWGAAESAFTSALTLDPTNKEAGLGLTAARTKNPLATLDPLEDLVVAAPDPDQEAKQQELDQIEGYRVQYQVAEDKVRAAEYHEAVPVLEELYQKLGAKLADYDAGRAPAAIRSELTMALKALQSNVQEAYENAIAQLDTEYSTQLADAEQFVTNRQYVQAREIYDQIIERAPYYYKVKEARDRLYERILSEAKSLYQGALIYESVGDLRAATSGLQKTRELLDNVRRYEAIEYRQKAEARLRYLRR